MNIFLQDYLQLNELCYCHSQCSSKKKVYDDYIHFEIQQSLGKHCKELIKARNIKKVLPRIKYPLPANGLRILHMTCISTQFEMNCRLKYSLLVKYWKMYILLLQSQFRLNNSLINEHILKEKKWPITM